MGSSLFLKRFVANLLKSWIAGNLLTQQLSLGKCVSEINQKMIVYLEFISADHPGIPMQVRHS